MKNIDSKIEVHVFVCTNQKPPGKECCALKGGKELREELKDRFLKREDLRGRVRINASGCLDKCSQAVACVIYPKGEWIVQAAAQSADAIEARVLELLHHKL